MHQYLSVDREISNTVIQKQFEQKYDTDQSIVGKEKKQSVQRHALRKDGLHRTLQQDGAFSTFSEWNLFQTYMELFHTCIDI